jgi:hypothetical protein
MDNSIFISDLRQELGNLTTIKVTNLIFKEYIIEKINDYKHDNITNSDEFIIGKELIMLEPPLSNKLSEFEFERATSTYESSDLLFDLINIVELDGYLPAGFNRPNLDPIMPTRKIIGFCRKYGMPFNVLKTIPDSFRADKNGGTMKYGFSIQSFRYRLGFLYSFFRLWKGIQENNYKDIDEYAFCVGIANEDKFDNRVNKIATIKRMLPLDMRGSLNLLPRYDSSSDTFGFGIYANDLFDVAYYQLAAIMTKGTDFKENLKICPPDGGGCGSIFWGHGNQKYCKKCNRKTIWSRKQKKQPK